ncbi:ABC transporter permease, partial [Blautia wexlerae]
GFMDIRDLLNCDYGEFNDYNYYLADSLSPDEAVDFYSNRIKNLKNWLETDGKDQFSEKEKSYLIRAYEKMKTPLYYDYQAGWKNLFQYSPSIIMILTLVLGFLCAGIFSGEFQLKANAVFYSSYYGRNKAVWAKVKAGAIIITAIYWAVMLLYTMLVLGILGVDGANCPIQSSMSGWKSIYNITNAQEYILIVLGGYLGCLFMQSLTMLVSAKTNSSVIAVIVPFILIFLPSFLSGTSLPLLNKILGLLPDQMLQMNQVVKFFNLYEIGGKVFCAVPILIISYSILLLLIVPVIYFIYRRKEVYN